MRTRLGGGPGEVLLDVDNGPSAPSLPSNRALYAPAGLASLRRALRPDGILAVWTPQAEDALHRGLRTAGFRVRCLEAPARSGARVVHTIYLARKQDLTIPPAA